MLDLDDNRWSNLTGGYKTQFDPRPLLARLETGQDTTTAWHGLWEELHHQGDVGDASCAAVPQRVRIYRNRGLVDWNTYAYDSHPCGSQWGNGSAVVRELGKEQQGAQRQVDAAVAGCHAADQLGSGRLFLPMNEQ